MTPDQAQVIEKLVLVAMGGVFGTLFGFLLACVLHSGAAADREQEAFQAGQRYSVNQAERDAAIRARRAGL